MKETMPVKGSENYVGFANLPNQVYRKAVKRGFEFTLMVVGESGLGKSTLINSMFMTEVYAAEYPGPSKRIKKTIQVETAKVLLKENGVNLMLTMVDTPGFGDAVDNSQCWQPISDQIENRYEEYLNAESRVHRTAIPDCRIHCCLYFIAPSGHGLKPLDIEFMKRLHDRVNIIPLIAKADTLTPEECQIFKRNIMSEIAQNQIKIYEFPNCEDEDERKRQKILRERMPFAVVGSNTLVDVDGKQVRGRKYPWGVAQVENMDHCDFLALRNMLLRTHMQDLKDVTNCVHYENFRCRRLAGVGADGKPSRGSNKGIRGRTLHLFVGFQKCLSVLHCDAHGYFHPLEKERLHAHLINLLDQMEEEKRDHETKMRRMEQEMEQVFEMKVREKMQKLKDSELDLQKRHEQMKKNVEMQKFELEEKRRQFEKEKNTFDVVNKDVEDAFRRMTVENNSKDHLDGKEKKKEKKKGLF